jgi:CubicO group peptidase (beta-lactamase class C family)
MHWDEQMISTLLDQLFSGYAGSMPGVSAMLLQDGVVQFATAFGLADVERKTPATPATNYRLASVSKQFTAMSILLLVADGCLALDDPLAQFFVGAPARWRHVTLLHLLTHTAGLRDYEDLIPSDTTAPLCDQDVLELVRPHADGYHAPGTAFRYSNTGYCLLALIVAQVANQPFAAFLRTRIFAPLAMPDTAAYEAAGVGIARRAFGYSRHGQDWTRTDQSLTSATLGDGGIYSSILPAGMRRLPRGCCCPPRSWHACFRRTPPHPTAKRMGSAGISACRTSPITPAKRSAFAARSCAGSTRGAPRSFSRIAATLRHSRLQKR